MTVKYLLYYYSYKMYFTMPSHPTSTPALSVEARDSHRRLWEQALTLALFAPAAGTEAMAAADGYAAALAAGDRPSWIRFVAAAESLVRRCTLDESEDDPGFAELAARDFFAQIVTENDDLLVGELLPA